ncbi:hypothetical protein CAP35_08520 [Chitinophagaceae bacterium IBVUCB1]|nr:hypothetical protein CAP35_08520 [Chitinophagaceae bacterium IBVUCB1]
MKKVSAVLLILLSVAVGALFIYSAFTKIYTLESFESFQYTIVEYVKLPWLLAALAGRALIGLEFALGVLIMAHIWGKGKWVLKSAILLTIIFSIYLVYLWVYAGNDINCGCFGDAIWMSPSTSLVKNLFLIIALWLLLRLHKQLVVSTLKWIPLVVCAIAVASPFIYYPIPDNQPQWLKKGRFQLDMAALYAAGKTDAPKVDLYKGKHVIAFFSLSCPHCRMAAYKMHIMLQKNPKLPLYMIIAGKDEYLADFWKNTKAQNIPYTRLKADDFTAIAGFSWPVIYYIKDGWVEAETNYVLLNQSAIEEWLQKP